MEIILTDEQIKSLKEYELWEFLFYHNAGQHIYEEDFSYDDMKIISIIAPVTEDEYRYKELYYEDMCFLSTIIRNLWNAAFLKKHNFPNLLKNTFGKLVWEVIERYSLYSKLNNSTEGYSENYAKRVCCDIIEKYLEFGRK